jgi:hypothetical protein
MYLLITITMTTTATAARATTPPTAPPIAPPFADPPDPFCSKTEQMTLKLHLRVMSEVKPDC